MPTPPANGTTSNNPFPYGTAGSNSFRIPSMVTLPDGSLLAAADIRYNCTYDGGGLDTIVSRSTDGGSTWNYSIANYLGDNGNTYNGSSSTAFIDPALTVVGNRVYMLVDLYPYGIALNGSGNTQPLTTLGFDSSGRLKLSNDNHSSYGYYLSGNTIYSNSGTAQTGYYVDGKFNIYTVNGSTRTYISNLFFSDSPFKVVRTGYLYVTYSDDYGTTWSDPQLLNNIKTSNEQVCLVAPGRGFTTSDGTIIFPVYKYYGSADTQRMGFIYSTDGVNWSRSADKSTDYTASWSSEATVVELADGTLRFFYRNGTTYLCYADYNWSTGWSSSVNTGIHNNSNCQMSAITYSKTSDGKQVILVSGPQGPSATGSDQSGASYRKNGKIWIGLVNDDKTISWQTNKTISVPSVHTSDSFMYSCMTEMPDGSIAILYEDNEAGWGSGSGKYYEMSYKTYASSALGLTFDEPSVPTYDTITDPDSDVTIYKQNGKFTTFTATSTSAPSVTGASNVVAYQMAPKIVSGNYVASASITIPIPEGWNTSLVKGFIKNNDNTTTLIEGTVNNGYCTFEMPNFNTGIGGLVEVIPTYDTITDPTTNVTIHKTGGAFTTFTVSSASAPTINGASNVIAFNLQPNCLTGPYTGEAEIRIPISDEWNVNRVRAFVVNSDATTSTITGNIVDDEYRFTMPHFSVGGIMELDSDPITGTEITVPVNGTVTETRTGGNYAGSYSPSPTGIASVTVTGQDEQEGGTVETPVTSISTTKATYIKNASGQYLSLSGTDVVWVSDIASAVEWTPYSTTTIRLYTKVGNTSYYLRYRNSAWQTTTTRTSGTTLYFQGGTYYRSTNYTNPLGQALTATTSDPVPASTTIQFNGIAEGLTGVTIGGESFAITVTALSDSETRSVNTGGEVTVDPVSKLGLSSGNATYTITSGQGMIAMNGDSIKALGNEGTATVIATVKNSDGGVLGRVTYTVNISLLRMEQNEFIRTNDSATLDPVSKLGLASGNVTYEITSGSDIVSISGNTVTASSTEGNATVVATVKDNTGIVLGIVTYNIETGDLVITDEKNVYVPVGGTATVTSVSGSLEKACDATKATTSLSGTTLTVSGVAAGETYAVYGTTKYNIYVNPDNPKTTGSKKIKVTVSQVDNTTVYYAINGGPLYPLNYDDSGAYVLIDQTYTDGFNIIFFAIPDEGYALTTMGVGNSASQYYSMYFNDDGTLSENADASDSKAFPFANPDATTVPTSGSDSAWKTGHGFRWSLMEGNMTLDGMRDLFTRAKALGAHGATTFTKNGSGDNYETTVNFVSEKLPTVEKTIKSVSRDGQAISYDDNTVLQLGDTITYQFKVDEYSTVIDCTYLKLEDATIGYIAPAGTFDTISPTNPVITTATYTLNENDLTDGKYLGGKFKNEVVLTYNYTSTYSGGSYGGTASGSIDCNIEGIITYQWEEEVRNITGITDQRLPGSSKLPYGTLYTTQGKPIDNGDGTYSAGYGNYSVVYINADNSSSLTKTSAAVGYWTFTGWESSYSHNLIQAGYQFNTPTDADTITFTGQWFYTPIDRYTVSYEWEGVIPPEHPLPVDDGSYEEGDTYTVDSIYTKDGFFEFENIRYTFSGWHIKDGDGSIVTGNQTMGDENVILVGSWSLESLVKDVSITKIVSGNLGDRSRDFDFSVTCSEAMGAGTGYTLSSDHKTATFDLHHNESVVLKDVPIGSTLTVSETAVNGYTTTIKANNVDVSAGYTVINGTGQNITVTNTKSGIVDSGIIMDNLPYVILLEIALFGGAILLLRKANRRKEKDD